jgi:HD-GYP domain-containing protein (c-di-GMP phosphodiesterase class II)
MRFPRGTGRRPARLFAVVDVWDALRSDRSYSPARSEEKVREHIRTIAGSQLDPDAVDIFLGMEWE